MNIAKAVELPDKKIKIYFSCLCNIKCLFHTCVVWRVKLCLFQNNVVILDEAHNVEKICEESVSVRIRSTDVALCIQEITQVRKA